MDTSPQLTLHIDRAYDDMPIDAGLDIGQPISPGATAGSASNGEQIDQLLCKLRVNMDELVTGQFLGMGANGRVCKAMWRDRTVSLRLFLHLNAQVAVKFFEMHDNRTSFLTEARQLVTLRHEHIVQLLGVGENTQDGSLCMLIEYAENGSLYDLLHRELSAIVDVSIAAPKHKRVTHYTCAHAISWIQQTAEAVGYLHALRPKPIIHRDLKSPNILLTHNCVHVRLADFGTATEQRTVMTNMKGSALWMAPEVFTGRGYSTACDVYSLGICLWEVLSRKRPYGNRNLQDQMAVLWQVHLDHRPDRLANCPPAIESIMIDSWAKEPADRPTIFDVYRRLADVARLLPGADVPLSDCDDTTIVEVPLKTADSIFEIHSPAIGGNTANGEYFSHQCAFFRWPYQPAHDSSLVQPDTTADRR